MRAPLLGQTALLLAALLALSSGLTGSSTLCPRDLDCARIGRHFCRPWTSHCGPCLHPLVENSHGRCVVRRRHRTSSTHTTLHTAHTKLQSQQRAQTSSYPELDEEIDVLSAIIAEQRTETGVPVPPSLEASEPMMKEQSTSGPSHIASMTETSANSSAWSTAPPITATNHSSALLSPHIQPAPPSDNSIFIVISSVFIVAGSVTLMIAGACWVRLQKRAQLTQKVDYPPYRLARPQNFDNLPGDHRLVQNAQMYHYQHQKQQMLSLEKQRDGGKVPDSGASTDEENEDGDFTVYECPGLAPTGEMEVRNPLFDDSTLYFQRFHK